MGKSTRKFDRWNTVMKSTWSAQVFNKYNDELNEMLWSYSSSSKFTYKKLDEGKAKWGDKASDHLIFDVPKGDEVFQNLKEWSEAYNKFNNWTNLNALLAISSNFETYLSTVVTLALDSNPGILFESSKSIDGISLLKKGAKRNKYHDDIIVSVTKGDWNSRLSAFKKVFGEVPNEVLGSIGELEKIRNLRNKIGHSFGRDIETSRNHEVKEILPIEKLTDSHLKKYQKIILKTVKSLDSFMLSKHIGEFQTIAFYHRIYSGLRKDIHQSDRAMELKKQLGKFGDKSGKEFCKELVKYYEEL